MNRVVEDYPAASAARLYRAVLLDVLHERDLALADYRKALKLIGRKHDCNADQAALGIWAIRSMQAERAEADRELRQHFEGRKPDPKGTGTAGWPPSSSIRPNEAALLARRNPRTVAGGHGGGQAPTITWRSPPLGRRQTRRHGDAQEGRGHQRRPGMQWYAE